MQGKLSLQNAKKYEQFWKAINMGRKQQGGKIKPL